MDQCTEVNQLMGREGSICYLLFYYIWTVTIIAISLISILDLFYSGVKFLLFFNAGFCKMCNDSTLSCDFFSVQFKNIIIEGLGKTEMFIFFLYQMFAIKCRPEKLPLPSISGQVLLIFLGFNLEKSPLESYRLPIETEIGPLGMLQYNHMIWNLSI